MVATTPNVDAVVASVQRLRVHAIVAEVDLHRAIARQLAADGIEASHEVVLGPRCRIDFLTVDGVGIEVKRGRTWGAKVRAQVGRYLAFDRVRALVLVTEPKTAATRSTCTARTATLPTSESDAHMGPRSVRTTGTSEAGTSADTWRPHDRTNHHRRRDPARSDPPRRDSCAHPGQQRAGETRAAAEVIDLMSRGRKRGFGGILLTQRISKLRKDAAAEAGNVFLGRTTLDIDVKRSAENLGMTPRDAQVLRTLAPGEWFAYGPALNVDGVGRFRAIEPRTKEPEKGQNATPPVRDPEAVAQLAAMVAESAADDRPTTLEDAEAQIRALRAEVDRAGREAETRSTGPTPEQAAEIARRVVDRRDRQWSAVIEASTVGRLTDEAENAVQGALAALAAVGDASRSIDPGPFPFDGEYLDGVQTGRKPTNRTARGIAEIDGRRVSVEQRGETWTRSEPPRASGSARDRLLAALAWWAAVGVTEPTEVQAAFVAGISPRSSTTRGAKAALRDAGLIDYRPTKRLALTEAGLEAAPDPGTPTLAEWHARIAQQLGGGAAGRAFVALLDAASSFAFDAMSVDELCAAIDVSPASSTTRGALAALRKLGLIEKGTPIRPTDIVYPKGLR